MNSFKSRLTPLWKLASDQFVIGRKHRVTPRIVKLGVWRASLIARSSNLVSATSDGCHISVNNAGKVFTICLQSMPEGNSYAVHPRLNPVCLASPTNLRITLAMDSQAASEYGKKRPAAYRRRQISGIQGSA
jgi:hypothetical protein